MNCSTQYHWTQFCDAVYDDDLEGAKYILEEYHLNINDWHLSLEYKSHPIYYAIDNQNVDMVLFMIDMGFRINSCSFSEKGRTCLHAAIYSDNPEMVKILLQNGADHFIPYKDKKCSELAYSLSNKGGPLWLAFGNVDDLYYENMDYITFLIREQETQEDIKDPDCM